MSTASRSRIAMASLISKREASKATRSSLKKAKHEHEATTTVDTSCVCHLKEEDDQASLLKNTSPKDLKYPTDISLTKIRDLAKRSRKFVGAHVSAAGGLANAVTHAVASYSQAFALFLRSQRRWEAPPLQPAMASAFREACVTQRFSLGHVVPHGSYLVNLANADVDKRAKSLAALIDDLQRAEACGIALYNIHPGSTVGSCSLAEGVAYLAEAINEAHRATTSICILLENMAGQGNVLGRTFEELHQIIVAVKDKSRIGVCLDTCHLFAAGYDIRSSDAFEAVMSLFDSTIGAPFLRALHLNDSKTALGSQKDRHELIGHGHIGIEAFRYIMNSSRFNDIPMVLETPVADPAQADVQYAKEVQLLYSLVKL